MRNVLALAVGTLLLGAALAVPAARAAEDLTLDYYPSIYFPGLEQLGTYERDERGIERLRIEVQPDTLGHYIVQVYKFFTGATAIVALFMVTYGGLLWLLAGGNPGQVAHAKEMVVGALTGLAIALLAYALLASISRGLVSFKPLDVSMITVAPSVPGTQLAADITCESPGMESLGERATRSNTIVVAYLSEGSSSCLNSTAINGLIDAGYSMVRSSFRQQIRVTSALRSRAFQAQLFENNCADCIAAHPSDWQQQCRSSDCTPPTCNPYLGPCPHTEGNAIDVFCNNGEHFGDCQLELQHQMLYNGFCGLASEAWHFENPKLSASCFYTHPEADGSRPGCPTCCNAKTGENCPNPS